MYRSIYFLKSRTAVSVLFHMLQPHGGGPHPKAAFTVKGTIDDHRLHGFRMGGNTQKLILSAFEMAISTRLKFHTYTWDSAPMIMARMTMVAAMRIR